MVNEDPATIPRDPESTIKTQSNTVNEDPAAVLRDPNRIKRSQWGPCGGPQRPKRFNERASHTVDEDPASFPGYPETGQQTNPNEKYRRYPQISPQTRSNKETHKSATVDYRPNDVGA